jgi:hypothetical protein
MPHLDLTDDEAAALTQELHEIVENDRYPFSPRIRTLMVTRLDRLARSTRDLLNTLKAESGRRRGREDGAQAEAHPSPESGGDQAARCGRADARHRQKLQRLAQHDFKAGRSACRWALKLRTT